MSEGQSFDARTLPLDGLRLIEASAGTGKTFSLAGLYLRLIVEKHASVRDILVMTFTRAATQELRERIRARLADAARIAYTPELADPNNAEHQFALHILDHADDDRTALARRLANAAARLDEATIVTIHGFSQRAATENAFESALAFDRGEQVDDNAVHREIAIDYWREHVFGADSNSNLRLLWRTPDDLYKTVKDILQRPHSRLTGVNEKQQAYLLEQLAEAWPQAAESLVDILVTAFDSDALLKSADLYKALAKETDIGDTVAALTDNLTRAMATGANPALPGWIALLDDPAPHFKKAAKHQALAEPLTQLKALPLLAELQPLARLVAIRDAVSAISQRVDKHKLAHRQYSFSDLIRALHDALHAPDTGDQLADALYERWPYALVDEFQDTDPLQYASLRRIYLDRPREHGTLLLIGDPKQAIYGFRGGDIYAYLAAAKKAGRDRRYTLATNYRSTQAVLDAIEALYRLPGTKPFVVPEIDFPTVKAGRTTGDKILVTNTASSRNDPSSQNNPSSRNRAAISGISTNEASTPNDTTNPSTHTELPALTFWNLQGGQKEDGKGKLKDPRKEDNTARLMKQTIARIGQLLDSQSAWWEDADGNQTPIVARDIAVLVNNHDEATTLQAQLARHGLMAVCQHRDSVFSTAEAQDLRLILRAMTAPDDATAIRAAQTTTLIGKRLGDLITLADDELAMQQAVEYFHGLHRSWAARGVLTALEQLFMTAAPTLLALTDGERRMSNYLQLGELLADAEAECFGMASLVRWLDQHVEAAGHDEKTGIEDKSQLRLESDANLIRINTVHAAKGLQYPIVFMPFALWLGTVGSPDKPPLYFHDANGNALIDLAGDDEANREQAVIEARSEALRLLYVGLTRAKQALFVGWREADRNTAKSALADLLHRDEPATADFCATLAQRFDAIAVEPVDLGKTIATPEYRTPIDAEALTAARSNLPKTRPHWSTYSFSRLAQSAPETQPEELPEPGADDELMGVASETVQFSDDGVLPKLNSHLSGVRFGSAVHDILEIWVGSPARTPWPAPGEPCADEHYDVVKNKLRQYGLIGDDDNDLRIVETANLIARTLHTPLPNIGPLANLQTRHVQTEMGFMLRLGGSRLDALVNTLRNAGYLPAALGGSPSQTLYGLMQGFIDVVAQVDGRYFILDYKTNNLGDTLAAYRPAELRRTIGHARYDLQYLIYTIALHRHLQHSLGSSYDPATHLGGVQYLFVRAMDGQTNTGVFIDHPDSSLIMTLDALFDASPEIA